MVTVEPHATGAEGRSRPANSASQCVRSGVRAGRTHHPRERRQPVDVRVGAGERMAAPRDHDEPVAEEGCLNEIRRYLIAQSADHHVEYTVPKRIDEFGPGSFDDADLG